MKVTFLLTRRVPDVPSPVLQEVGARLMAAGIDVDGWIPEDRVLRTDVRRDERDAETERADLYLLKSHTELALSYAGSLHLRGERILNDYGACVVAQDKVTASQVMREAGVPTPETWLVGTVGAAAALAQDGSLILKPNRGHRGADVTVVHEPGALTAVEMPPGPILAQRLVPGPGEDLKVYVAGDEVYAVRKAFDPFSFSRPGRPVPVSREVHDIAQRVRAVFGLELFGIDIIESPEGPVVVDVNYFPGYKGCPDPAPAIADVVLAACKALA